MKNNPVIVPAVVGIIAIIVGLLAGFSYERHKVLPLLMAKDQQISNLANDIKTMKATNAAMMKQSTTPNAVMMKDGKMWVIKDGQTVSMDKDMLMNDGTQVMTSGKVVMKDGSSMMMKDGEEMTIDGKMTDGSMQK